MTDQPDFAPEIESARRFAALSGPFDPQDALKASFKESGRAEAAVTVASHLAMACDTGAGAGGKQWLMRGTERRWLIENLQKSEQLLQVIDWRTQQQPFDGAAQSVVAALRGVDAFSPHALAAALAATDDPPDQQRKKIQNLAYALEWAGPAAPSYDQLERLRAVLNQLDERLRTETILANGYQGGKEQRKIVCDWILAAARVPPVQALFVTGLPRVGKSALLEIAVADATAAAGQPLLVVRLDFDRPVLDVLDQVGLTLEAARQISAQLPDDAAKLREERLKASGSPDDNLKGRGREVIPANLASALGGIVEASRRTVVMMLDTCEVLHVRGETHPRRLFDWLTKMVSFKLAPMAVIAAGRSDAFDSVPDRIARRIDLGGLTSEAAGRFLDGTGIAATARPQVQAFAQGNPLLLTLGAALASQTGTTARPTQQSRPASDDAAAAQLYRSLLSRIPDRDLRKLADPGLLVRRINFEVIRDVLAPKLGLKKISDRRAKRLVALLAEQDWLIERDPVAAGWLRQKPTVRAKLVPLFYASKPARCATIDRAAAAWFERRHEFWLVVESRYHRLQLTRRGGRMPAIERDIALRIDDAALSELPPRARDRVRQARGQRSIAGRGIRSRPASAGPIDLRAVKDLQFVIERGDWAEADNLYARLFETAKVNPVSEAGDVVRTFLWRAGRWQQAKKSLQDLDAKKPGDSDISNRRPDDATARLEMRAEFSFKPFVERLARGEARQEPVTRDAAWRDSVSRIVGHGAKVDMGTGALGFALRAKNIPIMSSSKRIDPIDAVDDLWNGGSSGTTLEVAESAARERMARRAQQAAEPPDVPSSVTDLDTLAAMTAARRLATHSPYCNPLALLARFARDNRMTQHARATLVGLTRNSMWWNGGISTDPSPFRESQDPIETLSDLGLVAEWAGAAAFLVRDRDLTLIAKGAETWRRTTAGRWSYDCCPPDWVGARNVGDLDISLWVRVHELLDADNPVSASRGMLLAWVGAEDGIPTKVRARLTTLAKRASAAIARGSTAERAFAAAHILIRAGAPVAFVPALATLVALKRSP
jgi:hypothetical protein